MRRLFRLPGVPFALLVTAGFSLLLVSCAEKSPEEKVEAMRRLYTAELTNFVVMQTPVADTESDSVSDSVSEPTAAGDAPDSQADDGSASEEEGADAPAEPPPVEVSRSILLDILVQNTGSEALPGITVDISQIDPSGQEKGSWKVFLELPNLAHGMTEQVSYVLEDADFVEGDGFHAEVRSPVPAAERGAYAEF